MKTSMLPEQADAKSPAGAEIRPKEHALNFTSLKKTLEFTAYRVGCRSGELFILDRGSGNGAQE